MIKTYPDIQNETSSHLIRVDGVASGSSALLRVSVKRRKNLFRDDLGNDTLEIDVRLLGVDPYEYGSNDWHGAVMLASGEASAVSRSVSFSRGMVAVDPQWLRGVHIGTYVFNMLINWAKEEYSDYQVVPIKLLVNQACTDKERDSRNWFYERSGFRFEYFDAENRSGTSYPDLTVSELSTVDSWQRNISVVDETNYLREVSSRLHTCERDKAVAQKVAQNLSDGITERYTQAGKYCRRSVIIFAALAFVVGIWVCRSFPWVGQLFG